MTPSRFSHQSWSESFSHDEARQNVASDVELSTAESEAACVILSSDIRPNAAVCAETRTFDRPCGVFVPQNYEPNYAYPLIVWLHDAGHSERDIIQVLPQISMRNYVGLALRGTSGPSAETRKGFSWSRSQRVRLAFQDELLEGVRRLRQDFHIHTERIYLAGAGAGASMAWDLFLARPEWFAGLAAFGGKFPWRRRPLRHFRALREKHLFLAPAADNSAEVHQADQVGRLMHTAGLEVRIHAHSPGRRMSRAVLSRLDYWIMASIGGCL
jgi:phospholipase/carboxylesterase